MVRYLSGELFLAKELKSNSPYEPGCRGSIARLLQGKVHIAG